MASGQRLGDRVITAFAEGLAAEYSPGSQPKAFYAAVKFYGLYCVA